MAKGPVNNARKFQSFLDDGGSGSCPGPAERALESVLGGDTSAPSLASRPLTVTTTIMTDKQTPK